MSGGYFDYQQYRLHDMAVAIKGQIERNEAGYSDETLEEFKNAIRHLQLAETYVQRIDWLVSADDTEECFHRRLKEDIAEIGGKKK